MGTLRRVAAILCGGKTIVQPQLPVNKQCTGNVQIGNLRGAELKSAGVGSLRIIATHLPHRDYHSHQLVAKNFDSQSGMPPVVGIEVAIPRGHDAKNGAGRERSLANISRPPCVVVRRHQNNSLPSASGDELADCSSLLARIFGAVGETNDGCDWTPAVGEVMLLQLSDTSV